MSLVYFKLIKLGRSMVMTKLVIFRLGEGSFQQGFPVTLQIGEEGSRPATEIAGKLPPAVKIPEQYEHWQSTYRNLGVRLRLEKPKAQSTNVSVTQTCNEAAKVLRDSFNNWLNSESFRAAKEGLLKKLQPDDVIRLIIQTEDILVQRIPWHVWELLIEDYTKAEIALSAPEYDRITPAKATPETVKILAILGNSEGIDIERDKGLLERLPGAEITFIVEPKRQELTEQLWEKGWDILFFAGHSQTEGETGRIYINKTDSLTIGELKNALRKAIERGLRLAIFNSCDGLGLARDLADLQIPQIIVMREPVPDQVAQEFLKYFLQAFARGESLYLAVREARERLQGIEDKFPCATWLPVICQNPAYVPPTWEELGGICADISQPVIAACPYRGLFAFREEDAPFFFGRESFTKQLVATVSRKRLVAVIGASGSGKSSVVFAGLIPQLRRLGNWLIISCRPSDRPFHSLAAAIIPYLESQLSETDQLVESNKLAAALISKDLALPDVIERILRKNDGNTQLLLVIDQFEELYTLCNDAREWLDNLLAAMQSIPQLSVVLTLRADFLGYALSYRPVADALQEADVKLGPMNRQELEDAIALPAKKCGVPIESGLTERILDAIEREPGNLPLLEFALTLLWDKQRNGRLNHAAYKEIGGVESALARHAEEVYDKLNSLEQLIAKRIFLELTQLGEGTEDTRRQVPKKDLIEMGNFGGYEQSETAIAKVIQQLANAKLIVTSEQQQGAEPVVDVAHEALIRHWPLLRQWVQENKAALIRKRRIEAAALDWQNRGNSEELAYLLVGSKLAEAENFLPEFGNSIPLSRLAQELIFVSQAARDRILQQEEARRQREIEQERKARKAAQRTTVVAIASGIVILVAGGFTWWRESQSSEAIRAVFLGDRRNLPKHLPSLLEEADRRRDAKDSDRALAFYRVILAEASKLKNVPQSAEISAKAKQSLLQIIQSERLPKLEHYLKRKQYGRLKDKASLLDFENQYTEGALQITYAIVMRDFGVKADGNDDGELNEE
jgi:CHAT domain/AAA ATPase domain